MMHVYSVVLEKFTFFFGFRYDVPYMYLQDAALQQGYPDDLSAYLISTVGLFNMMGNVSGI